MTLFNSNIYRAALMSQMTTERPSLPFNDLETLLTSDYSLVTTGNSSKAALFRRADPMSVFGRIWKQKMADEDDQGLVSNVSMALEVAWTKKVTVYHDLNVIRSLLPLHR